MSDSVKDLCWRARARGEPVPLLLALTIQVQVLRILEGRHRQGRDAGLFGPGEIRLRASSLDALLADPTRDPKVEVGPAAGACSATEGSRRAAEELRSAAAVTVELLTGAPPERGARLRSANLPEDLRDLLESMLAATASSRQDLAGALAASRSLALERLAAALADAGSRRPAIGAGRRREIAELRASLAAAIYGDHRRQAESRARRLEQLLGTDAAGDVDLEIARGWLAEQRRRAEHRLQEARRTSFKILVTAAPLVLATFLCGLLLVVMMWSV